MSAPALLFVIVTAFASYFERHRLLATAEDCPLDLTWSNFTWAASACSSQNERAKCCRYLNAFVTVSVAHYTNKTGNLGIPPALNDVCISYVSQTFVSYGIPHNATLFCGVGPKIHVFYQCQGMTGLSDFLRSPKFDQVIINCKMPLATESGCRSCLNSSITYLHHLNGAQDNVTLNTCRDAAFVALAEQGDIVSAINLASCFFSIKELQILPASIIGPVVAILIFIGNSAVIIGLWPAHFIWTYYCVAKTKRLGLVLKLSVLLLLPVPLCLWPVIGILGSILIGIGYGYFAPLIATFEAVGESVIEKLHHCFMDGCKSTLHGACTLVRDFTDISFHSYFSFMDELSQKVADDEAPFDIEVTRLPSCLLVSLPGVPIVILAITILALVKSPYMLLRGWQRLLYDLIGREGPFLETVCVPFAGLAILLWPLAVIGAVIAAIICSFFLGFYGAVVVYEEKSMKMGFAYIVSIISLFDEYTNDQLFLREGSCIPRFCQSCKE